LTFRANRENYWVVGAFQRFCRPIFFRGAAVALTALAWNGIAQGGEIQDAAKAGDLTKVQALVQADPTLVSNKDSGGETPLLAAAASPHTDVVAFLLANKADVNARDVFGMTALHDAARGGHQETAEVLLAHGAEVNAKDDNGLTPLYYAALMGQKEIAELFLTYGADVNAAGKEGTFWAGDTPLYMAACNGNEEVVEVLLAHHADLNARGKDGLTPLQVAIKNHHEDVAATLRNPTQALADLAPPPAPADGVPPQDVITRLVTDASKSPPGPVENYVTAEAMQTCQGLIKMTGDKRSMRQVIASIYNTFALEGPLTSLYAQGGGAVLYGEVKLSPAAVANYKSNPDTSTEETTVGGKIVATATGPSVAFGPGEDDFIDARVKDDGEVIASFCLVQQQGRWRVHCLYFSNEPLQGDNKNFILRQLAAFAKQSHDLPAK
jgi:hypothetical protein